MAKVTTDICRQAIVREVIDHPGCIVDIFSDDVDPPEPDSEILQPGYEDPAKDPKGWRRREKYHDGNKVVRTFQHSYAYDGNIWAIVVEDAQGNLTVEIEAQ